MDQWNSTGILDWTTFERRRYAAATARDFAKQQQYNDFRALNTLKNTLLIPPLNHQTAFISAE